jgi:hypothetical protein
MIKRGLALLAAVPLAGCQTFSFAPPPVETEHKVASHGVDCSTSAVAGGRLGDKINPTMIGAMDLINNFVLAYRCAEYDLADGRQYFQVPAFLAAAAGIVGKTVLGLSDDQVLMTGVASATLNAGNSYYAPRAKAGLLTSALRAVLCVKTEAVGVSYFRLKTGEKPGSGDGAKRIEGWWRTLEVLREQEEDWEARRRFPMSAEARGDIEGKLLHNAEMQREAMTALVREQRIASEGVENDEVYLDAERQYFEMVGGALFSIESILAERLLDAGNPDMTETFAKLKDLIKAAEEARKKFEAEQGKKPYAMRSGDEKKDLIKLENEKLHPLLQTCVLQART